MAFDKKTLVEGHKTHATDTGSPEVQVALITGRIKYLTEHFKNSPKDYASRSGFLKLISQRRRLLDYLKKNKKASYEALIKKLDLRK